MATEPKGPLAWWFASSDGHVPSSQAVLAPSILGGFFAQSFD